jgi:hypothetical protein
VMTAPTAEANPGARLVRRHSNARANIGAVKNCYMRRTCGGQMKETTMS